MIPWQTRLMSRASSIRSDMVQLALEASIAWGQFPHEGHRAQDVSFPCDWLGNLEPCKSAHGQGHAVRLAPGARPRIRHRGTLTGRSYAVSAIMARKIGPFDCYDINRRHMARVIRNHARVAGARNDAFEDLTVEPPIVDFDLLSEAASPPCQRAYRELDVRRGAWRALWLPQRSGERHGAYGHHLVRHGLRRHLHRNRSSAI